MRKKHPLTPGGRAPWSQPFCKRTWSIAERVAYYVRPDPLSGCHIWHGPTKRGGYGCLHYQHRTHFAHRLAWQVKHGPIPDGMILCHRCNVKGCCNPDHLFLGTRADNNGDIKTTRMRFSDARAATAEEGSGFTPDRAPIHIFCRGLELVGEVVIRPVLRELGKPETATTRPRRRARA